MFLQSSFPVAVVFNPGKSKFQNYFEWADSAAGSSDLVWIKNDFLEKYHLQTYKILF